MDSHVSGPSDKYVPSPPTRYALLAKDFMEALATLMADMPKLEKSERRSAAFIRTHIGIPFPFVMGTAAVQNPGLFERCARRHPARVLAALDIREGKAAVGGWMHTAPVLVGALVGRWDALPLAGMILTCIDRDGTMSGPDVETLARVRRMTGLELQYSGGISSVEDISRVAGAGAQAVVLGKALYEGRITLEQALAG